MTIKFSEREDAVIGHLLEGKSNKQIALALGIANRTVEFHLSRIYEKLNVSSRAEAILRLTRDPLRESTVAMIEDSTENDLKFISWRLLMKKWYFLVAGLSAVVLILVFLLVRRPVPSAEIVQGTATFAPVAASAAVTEIPTPEPTLSINIPIPPVSVNGFTAIIEAAYADVSHVIFQVRITGGEIFFGDERFFDRLGTTDIYDELGGLINASGGWGPSVDPALYQFEFVPTTLFKGDRIKGQFYFTLVDTPNYARTLAEFRFDFDLPIQPDLRFAPKQTVTANNLEILLDGVAITSTYTQVYLCFPPPSFADWNIGNGSILQLDGREAGLDYLRVLFDSAIGGTRTAGSEPYWASPIKDGRCVKAGFPLGSAHPRSFTLTIPGLEKLQPDFLVQNQFSIDYPELSPKQAYYQFLEERGDIVQGPWTFHIQLWP